MAFCWLVCMCVQIFMAEWMDGYARGERSCLLSRLFLDWLVEGPGSPLSLLHPPRFLHPWIGTRLSHRMFRVPFCSVSSLCCPSSPLTAPTSPQRTWVRGPRAALITQVRPLFQGACPRHTGALPGQPSPSRPSPLGGVPAGWGPTSHLTSHPPAGP